MNSTRRPLSPLTLEDARRIVTGFEHEYNAVRLHSGLGYVTPQAQLEGRDQQIMAERRRKLAAAHQARETAHCQRCEPQLEHQTPVLAVAQARTGTILQLTLNRYTLAIIPDGTYNAPDKQPINLCRFVGFKDLMLMPSVGLRF